MEARYARRKNALLQDCQVAPEIFDQVLPRLHHFLEPFVSSLSGHALPQHATTSVSDLLSDFPTSGRASVGVARQWCGRLGKVDTCHVAISLGYVSRNGHTLVDQRLFLPTDWTREKARLQKAGVPKDRRGDRTRHQLAWEMLTQDGPLLPHRWLAGDDAMGRPYWLRRRRREWDERYLLAVPSNTSMRDLEVPELASSGTGRRPTRPWQRVSAWAEGVGDKRWKRLEVRDGSKGPLVVEAVTCRVVTRTPRRQPGDEERVVVIRYLDRDAQQVSKVDYYVSNAPAATGLGEFARVAKAAHRIEACLERSKSEAGLAEYEVRHWTGWQQHQTRSLLATWFLERETQRGTTMDPGDHGTADAPGHGDDRTRGV